MGESYVRLLLMSGKQRDLTKPHCPDALTEIIFLLTWKFKTNFMAKSQLLCKECPLTMECKQKKNSIFKGRCLLEVGQLLLNV